LAGGPLVKIAEKRRRGKKIGRMEYWSDGKTGDILFFWILPFSNIPVFQYSTVPTFQYSMFLVAALPLGGSS
jgi:hypothetical protein